MEIKIKIATKTFEMLVLIKKKRKREEEEEEEDNFSLVGVEQVVNFSGKREALLPSYSPHLLPVMNGARITQMYISLLSQNAIFIS